jgi:hypothetical protein
MSRTEGFWNGFEVTMKNHKERWRWPVDLSRYDQSPTLSRREKEQIAYLATRHVGSGAGPWPEDCKAALMRLIQPVRDVLNRATKDVHFRYHAIRALLKEMHRRGRSYWSWSDEEWLATVGPTNKDFLCRHTCKVVTHRQPIFAIAYLLGGFRDFDGFPPHGIEIATLADTVFGREAMKAAVDTTFGVLHEWGYNQSMREKMRTALSYLLLTNRSPNLASLPVPEATNARHRQQVDATIWHSWKQSDTWGKVWTASRWYLQFYAVTLDFRS